MLQDAYFQLQSDAHLAMLWEQDMQLLLGYNETASLAARGYLHLGATYESLGLTDEAVAAYAESATLSGEADIAAWALYRQATLSKTTDFEVLMENPTGPVADPRVEILGHGMVRYPRMAELPWLASSYAFWQGRYEAAVGLAELAIKLGCYKGSCSARKRHCHVDLPAHYEAPYEILGYAYSELGMTHEAEEASADYEKALMQRESLAPEPRMGRHHTWHRQVGGSA